MGHEIRVFGRDHPEIPLDYTLDLHPVDAVVFIFEWTTDLWEADALDLARLVKAGPRRRRVILDGDGNYNDPLCIDGDCNHREPHESQRWTEVCDSLTEKICQPTLHPKRANVRSFLFYAYNPAWERRINMEEKQFGFIYLGNSKFRWKGMREVLAGMEPIRSRIGRVAVVGHGWAALPSWASVMQMEEAYYTDQDYLRSLGVEILPPVPFTEVIDWMSQGLINPVLSRPTFSSLRIVTPRFFETPAAGTIPIFLQEDAHVIEIYGEEARELILNGESAANKLADIFNRPEYYIELVESIRGRLREKHSHTARIQQLIEIIES